MRYHLFFCLFFSLSLSLNSCVHPALNISLGEIYNYYSHISLWETVMILSGKLTSTKGNKPLLTLQLLV